MSTEKALLRAIVEDPDDDLPRLAYADWLEEHGDETQLARADFIRTQVALARLPEDDPARPALDVREALLLRTHGDRWAAEVAGLAKEPTFRRGFVDEASVTVAGLLRRGDKLLARAPLTLLRLRGRGDRLPELARWPSLARVRGLELAGAWIDERGIRDVLRSPFAGGLRRLDLRNLRNAEEVVQGLRDAPALHSLRELRLAQVLLDDPDVRELVRAPWFANLTRLALAMTGLWAAGLESVLAHAPPGLTELDVSGNHLGDRLGECLGSSPALSRLKALHLQATLLGMAGLAALLGSPHYAGVTALDLRDNHFHPYAAQLLGQSPRLACLHHLLLGHNYVFRGGEVRQLTRSPYLRRLTRLDLSSTGIPADYVHELAASPLVAGLLQLDLSRTDGGNGTARALAESPHLTRLTHLNLSLTGLRMEGVATLARSPTLTNVVRLDLRHNRMDDRIAAVLATSPYLGPHATVVLDEGYREGSLEEAGFRGRVEYH